MVWYGDGTFSVALQLYTIHGIIMGQVLPLADIGLRQQYMEDENLFHCEC